MPAVISSSSMPVNWLAPMMSLGISPKKLPIPMEGSRTRPPLNPSLRAKFHIAFTVGGSV